jgi:hypothetical protein
MLPQTSSERHLRHGHIGRLLRGPQSRSRLTSQQLQEKGKAVAIGVRRPLWRPGPQRSAGLDKQIGVFKGAKLDFEWPISPVEYQPAPKPCRVLGPSKCTCAQASTQNPNLLARPSFADFDGVAR